MFNSRGNFIVELATRSNSTDKKCKQTFKDSNLIEQSKILQNSNEDEAGGNFVEDSEELETDDVFDGEDSNSDDYIPGTDMDSSSSSCDLTTVRRKSKKVTCESPDIFENRNDLVDLCDNRPVCNNSENGNLVSSDLPANKKKRNYPVVDKTSRKRKCNFDNWRKQKAKIARERGNEYISQRGKVNPQKTIISGNLCKDNCRLKCTGKFNIDQRKSILSSFYQLDINAKNALLFKCISVGEVKRFRTDARKHKKASYKYHITIDGKIIFVCKTALCSLYQIGRKKIDLVKGRISCGVSAPPPDNRGRHHSRPHKTADEVKKFVMQHIDSFPAEMSHYSRNSNPHKKYLSPLLSISKMHSLYIQSCVVKNLPKEFHVKSGVYRKIFVSEFNLSFCCPKSDTCSTCDAGKGNEEHIENFKAAFEAQKNDRNFALSDNSTIYMTVDLQQTQPLPKLTTSKAFYLRQLWFYNLGLHALSKTFNKPIFCTWTEDIGGKGSTEVCSSLLTAIELDNNFKGKKHLIVWSDSCSGQNKNFQMVCLYQYLILKGYFTTIDHKFPEVGHSYLDCDRDFGRIEKQLRKHEHIYLPDQYCDVINEVSRKNKIINMKGHFRSIEKLADQLSLVNRKKDLLNEKVCFRDGIKWIRIDEFGSYLFKECYDNFTPFRKVNILRYQKEQRKPQQTFTLPRFEKKGDVSQEKLKDIKAQLQFIPEEFRWYYNEIIEKFN